MAILNGQSGTAHEWLESDLDLPFGTGGGIDIENCAACGGAVRSIAWIEDPVVIQTILDYLKTRDETWEPFPLPERRAPPGALFG